MEKDTSKSFPFGIKLGLAFILIFLTSALVLVIWSGLVNTFPTVSATITKTESSNSISSQQLAKLDNRTTITDVVEQFGDGEEFKPIAKGKKEKYGIEDCRRYRYPHPEKNYQDIPDQSLTDTYTYTLCFNPDNLRLEYVEKKDGTAIPKDIQVPVG